jgi:signal peptidase II
LKHLFKISFILAITISLVGCDQATKRIAKSELEYSSPKTFLRGIVQFYYAENTGAFMGVGAQLPYAIRFCMILFMAIIVITAFILFLLNMQKLDSIRIVALLLLLSGALGNLADRIFNNGRVIDFIVLGVGRIHTGIFNFADVLITVGIFTLLFAKIYYGKKNAT